MRCLIHLSLAETSKKANLKSSIIYNQSMVYFAASHILQDCRLSEETVREALICLVNHFHEIGKMNGLLNKTFCSYGIWKHCFNHNKPELKIIAISRFGCLLKGLQYWLRCFDGSYENRSEYDRTSELILIYSLFQVYFEIFDN